MNCRQWVVDAMQLCAGALTLNGENRWLVVSG